MRFVLHKPRRSGILTSEMTFCFYCLSIGGKGCVGGRSIGIVKHWVKICINPRRVLGKIQIYDL